MSLRKEKTFSMMRFFFSFSYELKVISRKEKRKNISRKVEDISSYTFIERMNIHLTKRKTSSHSKGNSRLTHHKFPPYKYKKVIFIPKIK